MTVFQIQKLISISHVRPMVLLVFSDARSTFRDTTLFCEKNEHIQHHHREGGASNLERLRKICIYSTHGGHEGIFRACTFFSPKSSHHLGILTALGIEIRCVFKTVKPGHRKIYQGNSLLNFFHKYKCELF